MSSATPETLVCIYICSRLYMLCGDILCDAGGMCQVLVEKTDSDDSLIEALTEELKKVTRDATEYEKKYKDAVMNASGTRPMREVVAVKGARGGSQQVELSSGQDQTAELARLRRLVTQQGAQLETQETIIRQLRAKSSKK